MITIFKIIYWHSKECDRTDLNQIGERKYHSELVSIEINKSSINEYKRNLEALNGLKIDLYYKSKV
jgi:hypothetical protein